MKSPHWGNLWWARDSSEGSNPSITAQSNTDYMSTVYLIQITTTYRLVPMRVGSGNYYCYIFNIKIPRRPKRLAGDFVLP